jgi:hypothetical protein
MSSIPALDGTQLLYYIACPCCRALRARDELVAYFQEGITTARQRLAEGQEVGGVLGRMVSAQDEEGNRWVCFGVARGASWITPGCVCVESCTCTVPTATQGVSVEGRLRSQCVRAGGHH